MFFFLISAIVFGQNYTVSGTVVDQSTGIPLGGATILVKGTSNGTSTDFDGNFELSDIPPNSTLEFSYVGFITQELAVNSAQTLSVQLVEDFALLDEVIVIGYGSQTKKEITGAVSVVSSETIEELKPVRIEQALQGQVAGVQITSGSGAPGAGLNIAIRGVSTNGDNRPLILLDGNVIEDLSVVNPGDIESINVLKDATAGIYGVRAANGVILITTKNGSYNQEIKFDFKTYAGFQETTRKIPVLNATEYALLLNEARANSGQQPFFTDVSNLGEGTDWQDEAFDTAPIFSTDLTVSGGGEKGRTSFNVSYLNQDGIVGKGKSNFDRFTSRLSHDRKFLKNFKFNSSIIFSGTTRSSVVENAIGSVLYNGLNNAPTFDVRDEEGQFTLSPGLGSEVINPLAQIQNTYNNTRVRRLSGSFGLNYTFWEHFQLESRIQANYAEVNGFVFNPRVDYGNEKVFSNKINNRSLFSSIFRDYTFDAFAKYVKTFAEDHNFDITLGTSIFQTTGRFNGSTQTNLRGNSANAATVTDATVTEDNFRFGGDFFDARLLSYFARVQYDYKGKYLFSGVVRRDGSTKFGPKNKFGVFPSASVGWIVSEEDFFKDDSAISFLKMRTSYGIIGNDRIRDFGFESILNGEGEYVLNDILTTGIAPGVISNPEIRWEKQKTFDVGFDAKFFNNKLDVTFDYFNRETEDLLLIPQVSGILGDGAPGSGPPAVNAGSVRNSGFEIAVGYRDQLAKDLKFNVSVNATTLENEVLSVGLDDTPQPGGSFGIGQPPPSFMEVGLPIGYFKGLQTDGIFQSVEEVANHAIQDGAMPGDIRYVDTNGDGVINFDDQVNIGKPLPDVTFGFNLGLDFKNFDLQTYSFASIGNDIVRNYERFNEFTNRTAYYLNRWTGPGSTNEFPRVTTGATGNTLFSDFFVEDGSFLRVQNIQLGYTFGENILADSEFESVRLYASVNNAFTFTKYQGYDPTASNGAPIGGGIDTGFYPSPRTYLLGLNVKF